MKEKEFRLADRQFEFILEFFLLDIIRTLFSSEQWNEGPATNAFYFTHEHRYTKVNGIRILEDVLAYTIKFVCVRVWSVLWNCKCKQDTSCFVNDALYFSFEFTKSLLHRRLEDQEK